jgi:hypothetical protein
MTRYYDDLGWTSIINRRPTLPEHKGLAVSGRPKNFAELEQLVRSDTKDFTLAWGMFLDEFYLFKTADFFAIEPTNFFPPQTRAFFAGVVEYLGHRLGVEVPGWVEKPEYFLPEYWKRTGDSGDIEFRRRNIGYDPHHNLTRL